MSDLVFAQNIIFDLESIIANPLPGIINSLEFALKGAAGKCPKNLDKFIKNNLSITEILAQILKKHDKSTLNQAIAYYRSRYIKTGIFEYEIYDAIEQILKYFYNDGRALYIMTSKPQEFALSFFNGLKIKNCFEKIYGHNLKMGNDFSRVDILNDLLEKEDLKKSYSVMVSGKPYDVRVAGKADIESVIAVNSQQSKLLTKDEKNYLKQASYFCTNIIEIVDILT